MNTKNNFKNQRTSEQKIYTSSLRRSKDGTVIGYRQIGHGPGLVLLHGSMSSAHNHMELAEALAGTFTVYLPDRRGRGLSGPYSKDHSIQKDIDDLDVVLADTGAQHVFGISTGGIICLQAARSAPVIHKIAVYEPPVFMDNSIPIAILARFDKQMNEGKLAAALVTAMRAVQMGPSMLSRIPRWLLEFLTMLALKAEAMKSSNGYIPMRELAPTLHYDFALVAQTSGNLEKFKDVRAEVLLLGGSDSPSYLKTALDTLEKILPHVERVSLPGLGHEASWNTDRGGHPELVAEELKRYFA